MSKKEQMKKKPANKKTRITYKYRIYPTSQQRRIIDRDLELCRQIWNWALDLSIQHYEKHKDDKKKKRLSRYDIQKLITKKKKKEDKYNLPYSQCLTDQIARLDLAYQHFFRRIKAGENPGFPHFKKYGTDFSMTRQSQREEQITDNHFTFSQKTGKLLTIFHRKLPKGEIKTINISRKGHKYYVAFSIIPKKELPKVIKKPKKTIILTIGELPYLYRSKKGHVLNPEVFKKYEKDLVKNSKRLDKIKHLHRDDPRKRKIVTRLHKVYENIRNKRREYVRNAVIDVVKNYDDIKINQPDLKNKLDGNRDTEENRSIVDVMWSTFSTFLEWECKKRGLKFTKT